MAILRRGVLIAIEGIDGAGSSTQTGMLVTALSALGYPAMATKEPNPDGHMEATIRALLREERALPALDALLFAADRVEHVECYIKPWLQAKKIVVTDRYLESTLAYQAAQGLDPRWILSLNRGAAKPDRYEQSEFLAKVRTNFLKRARSMGYPLLDSSKPKEEVHRQIMGTVEPILKRLV
jgi:dTMP kinase